MTSLRGAIATRQSITLLPLTQREQWIHKGCKFFLNKNVFALKRNNLWIAFPDFSRTGLASPSRNDGGGIWA